MGRRKKKIYIYIYSKPFELKFRTIDGDELDISKLKGKVLLIDIWATWCTSCIAMQPRMRRVYEKYKGQGFEVISVSVDTEDKIKEILEIKHRIGATWKTGIIGGKNKKDVNSSLYREIWDKYAFQTVPILLLINKKGLVVGDLGTFNRSDFENKLQKLIKEEL